MLRSVSIIAALAAAVPVAGTQAATPPGDEGVTAARAAWVKVSSCSRAEHSVVFHARMRRLARGQRLRMRFTLLERGEDGRYRPVEAPGLRRWRKSRPGVAAFGWRQRVRGLSADSAYRARVEYRWFDRSGELERTARHRSGVCSQTGPLPNLRARIVGSSPTEAPDVRRYTVRVANAGELAAENLGVRLAVDGSTAETRTIPQLAARDAAYLSFRASPCTGSVTVDADPDDAIREESETDNSQWLACSEVPQR
jgi:hypothetical protein